MIRRSAARPDRRAAGPREDGPRSSIRVAARRTRARTRARYGAGTGTGAGAGVRGRRLPPAGAGAGAVSPLLRTAAAHAWRLLVVGAAVYAVFAVLGRFHEVAVAVFLGLVGAALLRPVADLLDRWMPRPPAVALAITGSAVLLMGVLVGIGETVAVQWQALIAEFRVGLGRLQVWLDRAPFGMAPGALTDLRERIGSYLTSHRTALLSTAWDSAGRVAHALAVGALGLFCAVFFIASGERQWNWLCGQLPPGGRDRARVAGRAAWRAFTGYTHGIVLVAATNAVLVGVALYALGVPLAVPLALLEFFLAFVPLIGSPIALAVAVVVALASKGPLVAALVVALIVVIGQLEGHVLHPMVMSWAVRLHPVVVALSVAAGTIAAGLVGAVVAVPLVSVLWAVRLALRNEEYRA
ncbi:AI-2E family transporter [Streptomyces sp. BR123]|uniref:AI-2E family transporter n=1 Tax=Streptomyces sp. BR123 TaxID=2749828 RepID=UPI0015C44410|nr:AI-2E family transporter [Streptomyces sp. BR123]NXY93338.1 AI-2E family transporter [Streptomyces sp. BR123]